MRRTMRAVTMRESGLRSPQTKRCCCCWCPMWLAIAIVVTIALVAAAYFVHSGGIRRVRAPAVDGEDNGAPEVGEPPPPPSRPLLPRLPPTPRPPPEKLEPSSFVRVSALWNTLEVDCRPFRAAGFNAHDLMKVAMLEPRNFSLRGGLSGRDHVREVLQIAAASGLTVARIWGHTNDEKFPFQTAPGIYNEHAFQSLDFVFDEARKWGLKIIMSLIDNWVYYNGVDQYLDWSTTAPPRTRPYPSNWNGNNRELNGSEKEYETPRHALFFTDEDCRKFYKNHVAKIINRRNSINGRLYRDDPTLLAYNLINEPRCESWLVKGCDEALQNWIEEMSSFVKNIDPNHLITIGSDGFFSEDENVQHNPADWGAQMGQSFELNNLPDSIDYATIHVWPDNWHRVDLPFLSMWIKSHVAVAHSILGKPVLLEEFGKKVSNNNISTIESIRDPIYRFTYKTVEEQMNGDQHNLIGSLFWHWDMNVFKGQSRGSHGVLPTDKTFKYIIRHAAILNRWTVSMPPHPDCKGECWVPYAKNKQRICINLPDVCATFWSHNDVKGTAIINEEKLGNLNVTVKILEKVVPLHEVAYYPTQFDCCQPRLGAFKGGCN